MQAFIFYIITDLPSCVVLLYQGLDQTHGNLSINYPVK